MELNVKEGIFPACYSPDVLVTNEIAKWGRSDDPLVRELQTRAVSFLAGTALVLVGALYNLAAVVVKLPIVAVRLTFGQIPMERGKWADDFPADAKLENLGWHIYKVVVALFDALIFPVVSLAHPGANIAMHEALKLTFIFEEEVPPPAPPPLPPQEKFPHSKKTITTRTFVGDLEERWKAIEEKGGNKSVAEIEKLVSRCQEKVAIWKNFEGNVVDAIERIRAQENFQRERMEREEAKRSVEGESFQPDGCDDEEWEEDEIVVSSRVMEIVYPDEEAANCSVDGGKRSEKTVVDQAVEASCGNKVTEFLRNGTFGERANGLQKEHLLAGQGGAGGIE